MALNYNTGLEGKTILITGSSRGIGVATARLAKEYGAEIILHGKTESERLISLAKELDSSYIFCDVANQDKVNSAVSKINRVDILVNNAGINPSIPPATLLGSSIGRWREIFDTNLFGLLNFIYAVIPQMIGRREGNIINISSVKSFFYIEGKPIYATSKAALNQLTARLAEELAPYSIRVNAVAPGFVNTDMTSASLTSKIQSQIDKIPMKRKGYPREIAEEVLFLASDKSSYTTGQVRIVDGGLSIV